MHRHLKNRWILSLNDDFYMQRIMFEGSSHQSYNFLVFFSGLNLSLQLTASLPLKISPESPQKGKAHLPTSHQFSGPKLAVSFREVTLVFQVPCEKVFGPPNTS